MVLVVGHNTGLMDTGRHFARLINDYRSHVNMLNMFVIIIYFSNEPFKLYLE